MATTLFRRNYATKYIGKVVKSTSGGRFSAVEVSVPTTPLSDVRGHLLPRRDLICKVAQILQSKSAASSPDPFLYLSEFLQTLSIPLTPSEASEILKSPNLALEFFHFCSSKISNFRHDAFTFNRILLILSNSSLPDRIDKLKEILKLMGKTGKPGNISTVNILMGAFDGADGVEKCLDMVTKWDLKFTSYTYKCLLQAYLRGKNLGKAVEVYTEMRRKGWKLDIFSYNMLLHVLAIEEKPHDFHIEGGCGGYSGMEECNISPLAAESIFHNAHLLTEILRRLPSESVIRFKSVCKSWRDLIITEFFCLLWRQHQSPGILLRSRIDYRPHGYVPLSGPTAGVLQFELPRDVGDMILQSCNGFLLHMKISGTPKYWVYNPATSEVVVLPPRLDTCKIHARRCNCVIVSPCLAFDSHSRGKVVALAEAAPRKMGGGGGYVYQVCVTENQGAWRRLGKPSRSRYSVSSRPVHWHNFIVWIGASRTIFYDVEGEVLRVGASPRCSTSYNPYHLGESGGHLHFIDIQGSRLIIKEMKHDLSGWFVKHSIELSQMEASLFRSIGWDINTGAKFKINFLIEEKEDSKLVLGCHDDVVLYRIKDHKSWKLCEWTLTEKYWIGYFQRFPVHQHVATISRFHNQ